MRKQLMAVAAILVLATGCSDQPAVDTGSCETLFGSPGENTGLDESVCRPERACEGVDDFKPPSYDAAALASLGVPLAVSARQGLGPAGQRLWGD